MKLALLFLAAATLVHAASPAPLPAPTTPNPGLRYYYPLPVDPAVTPQTLRVDICVYGGTPGGVGAAVQARRLGKTAALAVFRRHVGGLTAAGLTAVDLGKKESIGGMAEEFLNRMGSWSGFRAADAERTMRAMLAEAGVPVWFEHRLARVEKDGNRIRALVFENGDRIEAGMFIDATYEGDLMAAAGVSYHVGREANRVYGEEHNGVQTGVLHHRHHFGALAEKVSPYVVPGDPKSGVVARVSAAHPGNFGEGDTKVQAYCYRMCLTYLPENRIPFAKPAGYDPKHYELLARVYAAGWKETFGKFDPIPNHKTDTNNHGPFSTDNIGMNYDYPEASYERRREILQEHQSYQKGWLYFITSDPRVPADVRGEMSKWGLPKDEFKDNGGWPHQIYVREARRLIGSYVMTENELRKKKPTPESVGMGSYTIDSHNIQRYITPEGYVQNEGDIGVSTGGPYEIAFGSLVPKRGQADNLLVSVCVSSSHIAFGSIRMEPVFMILGQSAATAAVLAIDAGTAVQDVPYAKLRARLLQDGQILHGAAGGKEKPKDKS